MLSTKFPSLLMDHDQHLKTTDLTHELKYRKHTCKEQNIFDQEIFGPINSPIKIMLNVFEHKNEPLGPEIYIPYSMDVVR